MAWVKLSDDFWMHPKVVCVGDSAAGLYARLLSYCGCYLTDGLIPGPMAEMIVGKNRRGLEDLMQAELVARLDSGGLLIRDFLEYNRSKADWDAASAQRRTNGGKGGRPKGRMNEHA